MRLNHITTCASTYAGAAQHRPGADAETAQHRLELIKQQSMYSFIQTKFTKIVLAYLLVLLPVAVYSQWIQINGPYGGNITTLLIKGTTLFAGTFKDGMFRSEDGGTNWGLVNNGLNNYFITSIVSNDSKILVGTRDGLYISSDNGDNWIKVTNGLTGSLIISLSSFETSVFACTEIGFFRSDDSGSSWFLVNNAIKNLKTLAKKDTFLFGATGDNSVIRSSDDGLSWSAANNGIPSFTSTYDILIDNAIIYIGTSEGVFKSIDNGSYWHSANTGLSSQHIKSLARIGTILFAGTEEGIYRSDDSGKSWFPSDSGLTENNVNKLLVADNAIFSGTYNGIFCSNDSGANWIESSTGLTIPEHQALAVIDSATFTGCSYGVFRSPNSGTTWESARKGLSYSNVNTLYANNKTLYAGTSLGIFSSVNNGLNWDDITSNLWTFQGATFINAIAICGSYIYSCTDGGLFYKDSLSDWIKSTFLSSSPVLSITTIGNHSIIGTFSDGVSRSTDSNKTWTKVHNNARVLSFTNYNDTLFAGTTHGILRSIDSGATWSDPSNNTMQYISYATIFSDKLLFAATHNGIYLSMDMGATWQDINDGLPYASIRALAINNGYLFAGTYSNGIWKRPLTELITVEKHSDDGNNTLLLNTIYPNPFNPSTQIRFFIPQRSHVFLSILDIKGRVVAVLENKELWSGSYKTIFYSNGFSSGIYFCRLSAIPLKVGLSAKLIRTNKLVLQK